MSSFTCIWCEEGFQSETPPTLTMTGRPLCPKCNAESDERARRVEERAREPIVLNEVGKFADSRFDGVFESVDRLRETVRETMRRRFAPIHDGIGGNPLPEGYDGRLTANPVVNALILSGECASAEEAVERLSGKVHRVRERSYESVRETRFGKLLP